ncbi:alcohol dehydrogenase catalytic domain-containing protein [Selenomonas noxia]|jgi:oxidoreductase|uniref:alcohol dehydrogenase catalytic domain-containing protein n=1 Tax=Selenomonas noxia TaxID=135083 RepID=UPI002358A237|nr:zinc-binding dehydrogenase [Selenomonas noxia]
MMKAVVVYKPGGPEQLVYTDVPRPALKAGWSLVRVRAFGVNHSEIFTRQGLSPSVSFPRILGIECVGTVEETTDAVRLPAGQRVVSLMGEMGRAFDGGYAEYVLLPNEQIYPVQSELPWEILAAIPETYYTAFGSLKNLRIEDGYTVLVRGGASGVGIAFLRLMRAQFPHMYIVGSTRRAEQRTRMLAAGYSDVVIEEDGILRTDERYDRILELVGPAVMKDSMKHLARGGILCNTGLLGGKWDLEGFEPIGDLAEDAYLTSFYSGNVREEHLSELFAYIRQYKVPVRPERVFTLSDTAEAHRWLEGRDGFGKAVVLV